MTTKLQRYRVSDTVTYRRSWIVEARSEDEALDKAASCGPPKEGGDYTEEQTDNTPYEAELLQFEKHRSADPHCTCNDCIDYLRAAAAKEENAKRIMSSALVVAAAEARSRRKR